MDLSLDDMEFAPPMSPKITFRKKNVNRKGPSKLSLKKNMRRSSIYDKLPQSLNNKEVRAVEWTSSESTKSESLASASSYQSLKRLPALPNETVIVIDSTDDEESCESTDKKPERLPEGEDIVISSSKEDIHNESGEDIIIPPTQPNDNNREEDIIPPSPPKNDNNSGEIEINNDLSPLKIKSIKEWIAEVAKFKPDHIDDKGNSKPKSTPRKLKSSNEKIAINSTFMSEANQLRFDEWMKQKPRKQCEQPKAVLSPKNDFSNKQNIINNSDKASKASSLPVDHKDSKKDTNKEFLKALGIIVKSPGNIKNNLLENNKGASRANNINKERSNKKQQVKQEEISKNNKGTFTPAQENKLLDDNEEICKMLDSIYGNSWHDKKLEILSPRVQEKPVEKPKTNELRKKRLDNVDIYRNPYLDSERAKSQSLLKSLQKHRIESNLKSPFFRPSCVDDDTSSGRGSNKNLTPSRGSNSSNSDVISSDRKDGVKPVKLQFDDDDDSNSPLRTNKTKPKKFIIDSDSDSEPELPRKSRNVRRTKKRSSSADDLAEKLQNVTIGDSQTDSDDDFVIKPRTKSSIKAKKGTTTKQFSFLASLSKNVPDEKCDPSALIFKTNYKTHRKELAKKLFDLFNANIFDNGLPENTPIEWSTRMTGTAGYCSCRKQTHRDGNITRTVRVQLSEKILDSADRLRDTLVHELCHAATFILNKTSDGHGPFWRRWAGKAMAVYPELPPIKRCHDYDINYKYTYRCINCGYSFGRYSKSLNLEKKRCGFCYGKFEVLLNKVSRDGDKKAVPCTPRKEANRFALFVKENYGLHRSPGTKHADIMKILARIYQEKKTDK